MSSDRRGIVYLFTCDLCSIQYMGITKNDLRHRFWNHRHAIKTQSAEAIPTHMNSHTSPEAYTITPIFHTPPDPNNSHLNNLRQMESYFIKILCTTQPQGLNTYTQTNRPLLPIVVNYSPHTVGWSRNIKTHGTPVSNRNTRHFYPTDPSQPFA